MAISQQWYGSLTPFGGSEPVPEKTKEQILEEKLQAVERAVEKQSAESARKINEITEQNRMLKRTLEEQIAQKPKTKKAQAKSYDAWNDFFNLGAVQGGQAQEEKSEEKVDEIKQVIRDVVGEVSQEQTQSMLENKRKEEILLDRFRTEHKELHPYHQQVARLWSEAAQLNPHESMESRFDRVVKLSRDLYLSNNNLASALPQGGQPNYPTQYSQQGRPLDPVQQEIRQAEQQKARLEEYHEQRKKLLSRRLGYDVVQ